MLASFFDFLFKICYYIQPSKGNNMIKKIITDKNLIKYLTNREDNYLVIEYNVINLRKNNQKKSFQVHRLVAKAFIPNPNDFPIVNHKDENPLNNKVDNLEWCTQQHNVIHSKHKMYKQKNIIYSNINEKYIFKSKSISYAKGKKYIYDYYRVMIHQLNFDCRYSTLEKAIQIRNIQLKELDVYYSNIT